MIYNYYNFDEDFFNARGRGKQSLVLSHLSNLMVNEREAVINAFNQAGIPMDSNATPNKIKRVMFRRATKLKNPQNRKMVRNLSILIFANTRKPDDEFVAFFKRKDKVSTNGKQKSGWLKNLFKKKGGGKELASPTKPKGQFGTKAKDFYNKNKGQIGSIGKTLFGGLFSRGGRGQVDEQVEGYQKGGAGGGAGGFVPMPEKKGMGMAGMIAIGVVSLMALFGIIWAVRKGGSRKGK